MKKLFLVLSIMSIEPLLIGNITWKDTVKYDFYEHSLGLSSEEKYKQFIYPYLEEASGQLNVVRYCFNSAIKFSQWYIQILAEYSAAVFRRIALAETQGIKPLESELRKKLIIYKESIDPTLDMQEEFNKTIAFIQSINEQYYKTLGLIDRISLWGQRQLNKIFHLNKTVESEPTIIEEEKHSDIDKERLAADLKQWIFNENVYEMGLKNPAQLGQGNPALEQDLKALLGWGPDNWIGWKQDRVSALCKKWGIEDVNIDEICEEARAKTRLILEKK